MSRRLLLLAAAAISIAIVATSPAAASQPAQTAWAVQANKVCVVWLAKAKKAFGSPVTPAQLYTFALKAKSLESQELAALQAIPGRTSAGAAALTAIKVDIAEVGSAITAWKQGNAAKFVTILKRYINDERPKAAFALAGANQCG